MSHRRKLPRRSVTFSQLDDVIAEARALHESGYQQAGAWSLGQNCNHIAQTMIFSLDGFPFTLPAPIQSLNRLLFFRLPWVSTLVGQIRVPTFSALAQNDPVDDAEGVERLNRTVARFQDFDGEFQKNPVLGRLSRAQWVAFHLFHARRHFSFLIPESDAANESAICGTIQPAGA